MGGLAWTFAGKGEESRQKEGGRRYLMAGSIFGVAVAAALTGVVLTRGAGAPPAHTPTPIIASPISRAPSFARPKPANSAMRGASDLASDAERPTSPGSSAASNGNPQDAVLGTGQAHPMPVPAAANEANPTAPLPARQPGALSTLGSPEASESGLQKLAALAGTGDSKAQLLLGLQYLGNGGATANEAEAARWLARAAQQGEPFAQYRLATLYERGRGVPADPTQAARWYELAAKQGNRKAMHNLAIAFAEGAGEPKNPEQAAMWFNRAASLGLADSQFNLAVLYERGMGVHQSLIEAYKWYLIAAAQGDTESKTRAEALATQLSDKDRNTALQAAAAFKPQQPNPAANMAPTLG
jgi:localization factor PodJL